MNLVVQGPSLTLRQVEALGNMTEASGLARLGASAFRLADARNVPDVLTYCEAEQIDFGFVAPDAGLADFRLVALDMDSTLITIECIDELGALAGRKDEVAGITAAAMRGEMAFAESLRRRVELLAGLSDRALKQVYEERLQLTEGAEQLLARLKVLGTRTLLVSGGFTYFTERLKKRLAFDRATSNTLEIARRRLTGRLKGEIFDAAGKATVVREEREKMALDRAQVLVIGDGANDLPMMAEAGISIAYRAKPLVREQATYCVNHVGLDGVLNLFP
jgi:phosphoserine phosphatase